MSTDINCVAGVDSLYSQKLIMQFPHISLKMPLNIVDVIVTIGGEVRWCQANVVFVWNGSNLSECRGPEEFKLV